MNVLWQTLCVLWFLATCVVGGTGLLSVVIGSLIPGASSHDDGGWRQHLFYILVVLSGIAALAIAFDTAHAVEDVLQISSGVAVMVAVLVGAASVMRALTHGKRSGRRFDVWWLRIRFPLRLVLAVLTALMAVRTQDEGLPSPWQLSVRFRWHFWESLSGYPDLPWQAMGIDVYRMRLESPVLTCHCHTLSCDCVRGN